MNNQYLYHQIHQEVLHDITSGVYRPGDKLPTEKDLSEKYNVSRITSQKAMNLLVENNIVHRFPGLGTFVSKDFSPKISDSINTSNYNTTTNTTKHNIIGLVLESIWPSYGIELFDSVYKKASELGYHLIVKKSYGNQQTELEAIDELISIGAKGILLMPAHGDYYSESILKLVSDKFPIVLIDRYLNGIPAPYVGSNNVQGISDAFYFLKNLGHTNIGFLSTIEGQATTIDERKQGYIQACINSKSTVYIYDSVECIIPANYDSKNNENTIKNVENYIEQNPEVTSYIVSEHFLGKLLKKVVRKMGKRVPEDINIISFDSPLDYLDSYEFTHIHQDETKIGELAITYLDKSINSQTSLDEKIIIETVLIEGDSTKHSNLIID